MRSEVPEVKLGFRVIKGLATTLGELPGCSQPDLHLTQKGQAESGRGLMRFLRKVCANWGPGTAP